MPHTIGMGVLTVCWDYPIEHNGLVVGTAQIKREGLYFHIKCVCRIPKAGKFNVILYTEEGNVNLGLCVPVKDMFGLSARIPQNKTGKGNLHFLLRRRGDEAFYPFTLPFRQIANLPGGRFCVRDGMPGLLKTAPAKQGSDQIP